MMSESEQQGVEGEQPEQTAGGEGGSKEYVLDNESGVDSVEVDDKTITKTESASLTQDQYDRASADPDVNLVEAGKE